MGRAFDRHPGRQLNLGSGFQYHLAAVTDANGADGVLVDVGQRFQEVDDRNEIIGIERRRRLQRPVVAAADVIGEIGRVTT